MSRIFLASIISLILISPAFSQQSVTVPSGSARDFLAGEHTPIIFNGDGSIQGTADPCTTAWVQVGYASIASIADNRNIGRFNPEKFTLAMKLACAGAGDSAKVAECRFEQAYDTTGILSWNGDSSNVVITSGAYDHPQYGTWKFEAVEDTSRNYLFPVRMFVGGYVRLIFESDIADTCSVDWSLICEH